MWLKIKRLFAVVTVIAIAVLLAGCYRDYGPVVATPDVLPPPLVVTPLQVGDRLTITVYNEPTLTGVYDVTPSGLVVMPLIGAVKAAGRTTAELARTITERYRRGKFLQDPNVTVAVVEYRPIYIFGEVAKPGSYPYRPGLNVLALVTEAGGLTYRGSKDTIYLQRSGEQVWNEYPLLSSVQILPGDLIRIPERYF